MENKIFFNFCFFHENKLNSFLYLAPRLKNIKNMELNDNLYQKEKITIDLKKANWYLGLFSIPIIAIYFIPFIMIWGLDFKEPNIHWGIPLICLILSIILHELIHGVVFACYVKEGFKSIKFGVLWKSLTPYCHCKEPLKIKHYRLSIVMPFIVLGVIPFIISLFLGNSLLLVWGTFMTMSAMGDLMIIYLLKNEKDTTWVEDHPSEVGCFVYRKK